MKLLYGSSIPIYSRTGPGPHRWMFCESCMKYGILGENVTLGCHFTHGNEDVWPRILAALQRQDPNEIILLSDAWDVFFCCDLNEMERTFKEFNNPVVFSTETNLFPDEVRTYGPMPEAPTRWRYINGGQIMGYARDLLALFQEPDFWPRDKCWCNQSAYNRWWINHPDCPDFALDFHCRLFCCLYDNGRMIPPVIESIVLKDDRLYNQETQSYPCSFHGNGGFGPTAAKLWRMIS